MPGFPGPMEGSIFWEDEDIYACLAFHPITKGHTVVVWRKNVGDLNQLQLDDFLCLMRVVFEVRHALMIFYKTDKVYLYYLDEAMHVHIHLVPRKKGGKEGPKLLAQPHRKLEDLSSIPHLRHLCDRLLSQGGL